jgi:hypothetical protein
MKTVISRFSPSIAKGAASISVASHCRLVANGRILTAIAIAQQQKARSFELRAALDLGRLYNSTSRSADAHALLASALEGFSPTPEFHEIAEAQTLLSALAS